MLKGRWKGADPVIVAIALFNIAIRLLVYDNLEYHRDELLYLALGQHPDFGYATVPPLIGWVSWLLQHLFENSLFAIRLFASALGGIMIFLVASMARELGATRYGAILAATGLTVSGFFMRTFFLFHPVHLEVFLWTICILMVIKFINTGRDSFLIYFGIAAGFALLNKYLAGLLFMGLLLIIPFTRYRKVFSNRYFWIGLVSGGLIFLPNLVWQAWHGFPVFNHISELYDTQLVHMNAGLFFTEQLFMPFAGSVFTVAGLVFLLVSREAVRFRFLAFLALFVIVALLLLKGKSYYTLGVMPMLIAAGGAAYEKWFRNRILRAALPLAVVMVAIPGIPSGLPVWDKEGLVTYFDVLDKKYGLDLGRRFEDGSIHSLPQDYADMIGWDEFASLADRAYRMIEDKNTALIYAENYGQAGAITIIGMKYGLPEAVSFHESFRYWFPREFPAEIKSFIYINHTLGEDVEELFATIRLIGRISDPHAREYGAAVWLCEDPVTSFNDFWRERTADLR
ncbi:MAG: glycosyltransferase family 39 protein [Bacteroidales bacterium]|nr:glycosyltransferase family 39 protein [Bacteroidales bacterium]